MLHWHSHTLAELLARLLVPENESKHLGVHQGQWRAAVETESSWDTAMESVSVYHRCQLDVY